ncbi:sugar 3,4-ketoisomerase [Adhaeribacter radiodurans]|uniref:FdtA/QdtA family cupin domain-containing protein n=1 Tax=Adhaeribacter radiodurans TaxID=2745197 RepID=A0A7L7L584_9BACT|nr:FdtA/QdtA family cupin domain-containing protein [Adhaeribacter radiodurans]QMU27933.1 FdtA/QdtA family cupin domain-containing protein [Adhaeribacter radiodurans]
MVHPFTMGQEPVLFDVDFSGTEQEGYIVSTQQATAIPFPIQRVFWSFGVPENYVRGNHAHRQDQKVLIALKGRIVINTETDQEKQFILNSPFQALYVPALCWTKLTYAPNSVLLALSSSDFNEADYIRDYPEFKLLRGPLSK